ncbi:hypothetical protein RHGRI_010386 [Rhododendron griersonianum]|uniref:Uncharacterized protein n=1 Tax=Rhododendron griersonianum TaxID=479676 RepID=A0AAV6KIB1_9ERIC|nr:hypothetical protein RHGRI_010386 [Rhododendron griersonianum]
MASLDSEIARTQEEKRAPEQQLASLTLVTYDKDLCGGSNRFEDYEQSIPVNNEKENVDAMDSEEARKLASYTAPKSTLKDMPRGTEEDLDEELKSFIREKLREEEYKTLIGVRLTSWDLKRRIRKKLRKDEYKTSRDRHYAFAAGDKTPDLSVRTFQDVIQEYELWREKEKMLRAIAKEEEERKAVGCNPNLW